MTSIHFIITGGTIDKAYDPVTETPQSNETSIIPDYIKTKIRPHFETSFETLCMIDSNDMSDEIRAQIAAAVHAAPAKRIIITHGTSTMDKTALYLEQSLGKDHGKTVILVGAMIPMKEFSMSDAGFNLGYAAAQAQNLEQGIYICMHGETFTAQNVEKNIEDARFERCS